jgi:hypothetical protein
MWSISELKLAFRALLKHPVMLRPLPFRDADRVVLINEHTPQFPLISLSAENYRDVCKEAQSLQACGEPVAILSDYLWKARFGGGGSGDQEEFCFLLLRRFLLISWLSCLKLSV